MPWGSPKLHHTGMLSSHLGVFFFLLFSFSLYFLPCTFHICTFVANKQVIYAKNVAAYPKLIPFLTLIVTSLALLHSLAVHAYWLCKHYRMREENPHDALLFQPVSLV